MNRNDHKLIFIKSHAVSSGWPKKSILAYFVFTFASSHASSCLPLKSSTLSIYYTINAAIVIFNQLHLFWISSLYIAYQILQNHFLIGMLHYNHLCSIELVRRALTHTHTHYTKIQILQSWSFVYCYKARQRDKPEEKWVKRIIE